MFSAKKTITRSLFAATTAAVILAGTVGAHAGEDAIKYRKAVMSAIGAHMGAISTILKTGAGDMKDIPVHADAMAGLANMTGHLFPRDSGPMDGETATKPEVWEKPEDFNKIVMAFVAEAEKLATVSKTGDKAAIGAQLGALGKNACKACHDGYKEKKS